jgi:hypothetical protein
MSKKTKTVVVSEFSPQMPIPVATPKPKIGNGAATFKTATAAAKAAMEARDEARGYQQAAHATALAVTACRKRCEEAELIIRRDMWVITAMLAANFLMGMAFFFFE